MYETEANHRRTSLQEIPSEIVAQFRQLKGSVLERTVLPWSEHCTECVWPTCYTTCDLYSPREDGRCRRFADGMVRIECPGSLNGYLLKITFKRWGKLWTPGNIRLKSADQASRIEQRDYRVGTLLYQLPVPTAVKTFAIGKRYSFKKKITYHQEASACLPACFLLEIYNPHDEIVPLSLTMRSVDERTKVPFQKLIKLHPGFQCVRVPRDEITAFLDVRSPFNVELVPSDRDSETTLFFGLIDFVREAATSNAGVAETKSKGKLKPVKCVVWDLDNTLWDGILIEDGLDALKLKPGIRETLRALDERGILHSIASKNNQEDALAALKEFQLDEYFLVPQISWQPKSEGIQVIARQLNIGMDSLLFVDDSEFELQQVQAVHGDVAVLNANRALEIPRLERCLVPVTAESHERRRMYQVEAQRQDVAQSFAHDYKAFLLHCQIKLTIRPMLESNLERVHELTQRTNQMNFSGNRYDRSVLKQILSSPDLDTYVLEVEDRFGSYGVVGFSIVDRRMPLMTDLMFSCRIQAKRIEHAFLSYLLRKYIGETEKDFYADYRETPRNAPSGRVFSEIGMEKVETRDGLSRLLFRRYHEVPDDGIVNVCVHDPVSVA